MFSKQNDKSNSETQEAYLGGADKKLQELILLSWSKKGTLET